MTIGGGEDESLLHMIIRTNRQRSRDLDRSSARRQSEYPKRDGTRGKHDGESYR